MVLISKDALLALAVGTSMLFLLTLVSGHPMAGCNEQQIGSP